MGRATQANWTDAFGNQVAERTNVLDIAAHYPQNPERLRLFKNGTRQLRMYNSVPEYTHDFDVHKLAPTGGDTITMRSAERPRYVVQYELAATWAFSVNQSLQSGDRIEVGLYDGTDGWYMEQTGAHADDEADFVAERNGSEVYRVEDVDIFRDTQKFVRNKLSTGWYNITRQAWERSYPNAGDQVNSVMGRFNKSLGDRGPRYGNLPLWYSVTSSNGLVLEAGSAAQVNLGKTTPLIRNKTAEHEYTFGTTGTWVPMLALRVDPNRNIISAQIRRIQVSDWTGNGDVKIIAKAHDPRNVEDGSGNQLVDGDFETSTEREPLNSVIEESTAVGAAADSSGTVVTSTDSPGGYQVGWDAFNASGAGGGREFQNTQSRVKKQIYEDDVIVFWGNADNTSNLTFEETIEEDW